MDADTISYKAMIATEHAANWALGSMIGTLIGAVTTSVTLFFAYKALNTWRQQEALKIKIDFKSAAVELLHAINAMPNNWSFHHVNAARGAVDRGDVNSSLKRNEVQIYYLKRDMVEANRLAERRWMMCEQLFKDSEVAVKWKNFQHDFFHYAMKGGNKADILPGLENLISRVIIF